MRTRVVRPLVVTVVALVLGANALPAARGSGAAGWTTAWATSLHGSRDFGSDPWALTAFPVRRPVDQTVRLVVPTAADGTALRLRLSNRDGEQPLTFGHVVVGRRTAGAGMEHGTAHDVRFGGRLSLTLAPGQAATSDPVPLATRNGGALVVSVWLAGEGGTGSWHRFANVTSFVAPPASGDVTAEESGTVFAQAMTSWFWLDAVEVVPPAPTPVVVALGDSITDGFPVAPDLDQPWPAALNARVRASGLRVAVVNAGIAGNRVLRELSCGQCGIAAVDRLEADALGRPGIRTLIVFEGTNDLAAGSPAKPIADAFVDIVRRAHARGVRVIGATITPRGGSAGWSPGQEVQRQLLNDWIRRSPTFDAVVDFDAVLRDPAAPERLQLAYDSGDGLHPNALGLAALADAVPLRLLAG